MKKNDGKPSKRRITQFAILYVLSESKSGPLSFSDLEFFTQRETKYIVNELKVVLSRNFVKKKKEDVTYYSITKAGETRLEYLKKTIDYKKYWKPTWVRNGKWENHKIKG